MQECGGTSSTSKGWMKKSVFPATVSSQASILYTVVKQGVWYEVVTRPGFLSFVGKSIPELDPYGFYFDESRPDVNFNYRGEYEPMRCYKEATDQYRCECIEKKCMMTIIYKLNGLGRFDFLFYDGVVGTSKKPELFRRLYSDGNKLYELIYSYGKNTPTHSNIYEIEKIIPLR